MLNSTSTIINLHNPSFSNPSPYPTFKTEPNRFNPPKNSFLINESKKKINKKINFDLIFRPRQSQNIKIQISSESQEEDFCQLIDEEQEHQDEHTKKIKKRLRRHARPKINPYELKYYLPENSQYLHEARKANSRAIQKKNQEKLKSSKDYPSRLQSFRNLYRRIKSFMIDQEVKISFVYSIGGPLSSSFEMRYFERLIQNISESQTDCPQMIKIITPHLRKINMLGNVTCHLIQSPYKIHFMEERNPVTYKGFYLVSLSSNLEPMILTMVLVIEDIIEKKRQDIYQLLLETYVQINVQNSGFKRYCQNQNLNDASYENIYDAELAGNYKQDMIKNIICHKNQDLVETCKLISAKHDVGFRIIPNFQQRLLIFKGEMLTNEIKKKPYLKQQVVKNIRVLLECGNVKKANGLIEKINEANDQFVKIFKHKALHELMYLGMPKEFVGFELLEKYEELMVKFIRSLTLFKKGENLVSFIDSYLKEQNRQSIAKNIHYCDYISENGIIQPKLNKLKNHIKSNVFAELVHTYEKSLSLSMTKVSDMVYEVGKLGHTSVSVTLEVDEDYEPVNFSQQTEFSSANVRTKGKFSCECYQNQKIGICCEHLLRVFREQNVNILDYVNEKFWLEKEQKVIEID